MGCKNRIRLKHVVSVRVTDEEMKLFQNISSRYHASISEILRDALYLVATGATGIENGAVGGTACRN